MLEKTLESPLDCKEIQPSILKEISPGCSLEGLMLKLNLQYFGHLVRRVDSLEKHWCWEGLGTRGEGDDRGWDGWMASPSRWTWVWVNSGSWWWTGRPGMLRFMGSQRVGHDWVTELNWYYILPFLTVDIYKRWAHYLFIFADFNTWATATCSNNSPVMFFEAFKVLSVSNSGLSLLHWYDPPTCHSYWLPRSSLGPQHDH